MKKNKKPILSIGIIFKNEIRCMERCLESLKPLREAISCELVMADTGSEDGTREIAEKYADILIDFPWINDFAAARNAVLDRSSGEWFMSLDADEWLDSDIGKLVEFLSIKQQMYHLASYTIRNFRTPNVVNDENFQDFYAMRIMRNGMGIRYEGCIHEHWKYPESLQGAEIVQLKALVYHDGYAFASNAAMKAKYDRNMELLKKKLEEDPDDLQTLTECIDATKAISEESGYYARRALEVLHQNWARWGTFGARIYRDAVATAQLQKLPELLEWSEKALELYPNSIYVRVDISYCAFARSWDEKDIPGALRWAGMYRKGLADYRAGDFEHSEMLRGILEFASPYWERRMLIMQTETYLQSGEYDKAFSVFECINGAELDGEQQVEACTQMLLRLQRESTIDTALLAVRFWEQINQPKPDEQMAEKRRIRFVNVAAAALTPQYRAEESGKDKFKRHGYTCLLPLEGKCVLGDGAAVLEVTDLPILEQKLLKQELEEFPISSLAHALICGVDFPLPGRTMSVEEMDAIAARLIPMDVLHELCFREMKTDLQHVCWQRALMLAHVSSCKWEDADVCLPLARKFAEFERQFLPRCYTEEVCGEKGIFLLPPLHRLGWYCACAFEALDTGDKVGYVRMLRSGLEHCKHMKSMVSFLIENVPELKPVQLSDEMKALADQIRTILSAYAPDDPAVALLKQSEAYQKVAYLIEGAAVPVMGGPKQ